MTSLDIPSDDDAMVLYNDHIFGLDCPATKPSTNFPSESDLTVGKSPDIGINESFDSTIVSLMFHTDT